MYPYAEHPDTDIWCMAWAFDDEEPEIWWPKHVLDFMPDLIDPDLPSVDSLPPRVYNHLVKGGEIRAHNAEFERIMWWRIMHERYGFPNPKLEQWVCSAAEAAAMSLPRGLGEACRVTQAPHEKDTEGYNLMLRMCRPRSKKGEALVWWYDRERILRLGDYCKQDVRSEKGLSKVLRRLQPREREHYLEICRQNDAGIAIDVALVQACRRVADVGLERANALLEELTEGAVSKVTNHQRLGQWIRDQGIETPGVAKKHIAAMLDGELVQTVRDVLVLRSEAGKSSLAKLDAMLTCLCADNRVRGMIVFHGASTGRETAKLVQPHNFPRGGEVDNVEQYISPMMREAYDEINLFHHPIVVVSEMLRATLTGGPGNELIAGDFSGIEARVVNWVAGQEDMLDNFRALDAGDKTRDPYIINAMRYYKLPFEQIKKIPHRQTGKFQELGCGFGMGAKTGRVQAKDVYGLDITEEETQELVTNYRQTHAEVKKFWKTINNASIAAVEYPGTNVRFGPLQNMVFTKRGAYLYLMLPSKRPLVYALPKIVERVAPWSTPEKPATTQAVRIFAVNPKTKVWSPQDMYGGIWTENVVQAIARDLMAEAKLRVRAAGYPSNLTVHDEVVAEVPAGFGDVKEYERLLTELPEWAAGLPVAAEAWRGFRYRKYWPGGIRRRPQRSGGSTTTDSATASRSRSMKRS